MLNDYIQHIRETNNKSLLARIYGIYTIQTNMFAPLDVIVMQNTCKLVSKSSSILTFDLKGSLYKRISRLPISQYNEVLRQRDCQKVLKDLNYLELNKDTSGCFLDLSPETIK